MAGMGRRAAEWGSGEEKEEDRREREQQGGVSWRVGRGESESESEVLGESVKQTGEGWTKKGKMGVAGRKWEEGGRRMDRVRRDRGQEAEGETGGRGERFE
eukprot:5019616-Pleurochrysis_carterae.AAC.3